MLARNAHWRESFFNLLLLHSVIIIKSVTYFLIYLKYIFIALVFLIFKLPLYLLLLILAADAFYFAKWLLQALLLLIILVYLSFHLLEVNVYGLRIDVSVLLLVLGFLLSCDDCRLIIGISFAIWVLSLFFIRGLIRFEVIFKVIFIILIRDILFLLFNWNRENDGTILTRATLGSVLV